MREDEGYAWAAAANVSAFERERPWQVGALLNLHKIIAMIAVNQGNVSKIGDGANKDEQL